MTKKSPEKARARALQDRTGWAYSECLRSVRNLSDEQIERLIKERVATSPPRSTEVK